MSKYEILETCILRTDDDGKVWSIPTDPANSDYQAYLKSLDEQQAAQNPII